MHSSQSPTPPTPHLPTPRSPLPPPHSPLPTPNPQPPTPNPQTGTLGDMQATGFVGLGKMGQPMVRRLLQAGFAVQVYNRSPEKAQALAEDGAQVCGSAREVAERADVVMTALPTPDSVEAVYAEMAEAAKPGQIFTDHSTVSPGLNRQCADMLQKKQAAFLDAPVSGG